MNAVRAQQHNAMIFLPASARQSKSMQEMAEGSSQVKQGWVHRFSDWEEAMKRHRVSLHSQDAGLRLVPKSQV